MLLYVRKQHDHVFTALILDSPTVHSLLLAVRITLYQSITASPRVKSGVDKIGGVEWADWRGNSGLSSTLVVTYAMRRERLIVSNFSESTDVGINGGNR